MLVLLVPLADLREHSLLLLLNLVPPAGALTRGFKHRRRLPPSSWIWNRNWGCICICAFLELVLVLLVPLADLREHSLLLQLNLAPPAGALLQVLLLEGSNIVVDCLHLRGFGIEIGDAYALNMERASWPRPHRIGPHMGLFGLLLAPSSNSYSGVLYSHSSR